MKNHIAAANPISNVCYLMTNAGLLNRPGLLPVAAQPL
jgi:hypothetical protein